MEPLERLIVDAQMSFSILRNNKYPGRGIVVGLDETGSFLVQVYWLTGRSENSRNRVLKSHEGRLYTEAADPANVQDPSLIIYNAMQERLQTCLHYIVSNGNQTDTVANYLIGVPSLDQSLHDVTYEPDAPNFTPRITALCSLRGEHGPLVQMSILRKSAFGDGCDRTMYSYETFCKGFGWCLTTYTGDGDPLPSFRGEPQRMPLTGGIEECARQYWGALDPFNRIALATKFINLENGVSKIHIINKYPQA